jgi:hypothetical protein
MKKLSFFHMPIFLFTHDLYVVYTVILGYNCGCQSAETAQFIMNFRR